MTFNEMVFRHHTECLSYETTASGSPTWHNNRPPLAALPLDGDMLSLWIRGATQPRTPAASCWTAPAQVLPPSPSLQPSVVQATNQKHSGRQEINGEGCK